MSMTAQPIASAAASPFTIAVQNDDFPPAAPPLD